jgi:hypothetical protein
MATVSQVVTTKIKNPFDPDGKEEKMHKVIETVVPDKPGNSGIIQRPAEENSVL